MLLSNEGNFNRRCPSSLHLAPRLGQEGSSPKTGAQLAAALLPGGLPRAQSCCSGSTLPGMGAGASQYLWATGLILAAGTPCPLQPAAPCPLPARSSQGTYGTMNLAAMDLIVYSSNTRLIYKSFHPISFYLIWMFRCQSK